MRELKLQIILISSLLLANAALAQQQVEPEYFKEDFPSTTYVKRSEAGKLFEQGKKDYEIGDYATALENFKQTISMMPDHTMAYFYRAGIREHNKDYKSALTDYDIVIHLDPTINEAYFNRGMLRYKLEDYRGAIDDFTRLLTMPLPNTQVVYYKGTSYGEGGRGATGIISMYSKDADIYNYLGLSKTKMGEIENALKDFNKALEINSTDANIYVNRGIAYVAGNKPRLAEKDFNRALELEPNHAVALFNLGLSGEGHENDMGLYDDMITKNEDFPSAYINRGLIKFRSGDFEEAIADYSKAIILDPSNAIAFLNRALAFEKLEKYSEALKDLNNTIKLDPHLLKAYSSRGNVYFKLQEYEDALQDYNEVIKSAMHDASLFYNRALVKYKLKLKDEACLDLQLALDQGYGAAQKALNSYCK